MEVVAETASTNALLAQRAREGAPEGPVVVAEHQSRGPRPAGPTLGYRA